MLAITKINQENEISLTIDLDKPYPDKFTDWFDIIYAKMQSYSKKSVIISNLVINSRALQKHNKLIITYFKELSYLQRVTLSGNISFFKQNEEKLRDILLTSRNTIKYLHIHLMNNKIIEGTNENRVLDLVINCLPEISNLQELSLNLITCDLLILFYDVIKKLKTLTSFSVCLPLFSSYFINKTIEGNKIIQKTQETFSNLRILKMDYKYFEELHFFLKKIKIKFLLDFSLNYVSTPKNDASLSYFISMHSYSLFKIKLQLQQPNSQQFDIKKEYPLWECNNLTQLHLNYYSEHFKTRALKSFANMKNLQELVLVLNKQFDIWQLIELNTQIKNLKSLLYLYLELWEKKQETPFLPNLEAKNELFFSIISTCKNLRVLKSTPNFGLQFHKTQIQKSLKYLICFNIIKTKSNYSFYIS